MIIVHHLEHSRSQRIVWLLEELGQPYELIRYPRDPLTLLAPAALRRIHPLGKSPLITDDGQTLAESGAIIEYLLDRYGDGRLRPQPGSAARQRYTYWLHYAEGSAMPPLLLKLVFTRLPQSSPWWLRPLVSALSRGVQRGYVEPPLATHLAYWEAQLGQRTWFADDDFSAADIQMSYPVEAMAALATGPAAPRVREFLRRLRARPAYQRALSIAGASSFASAVAPVANPTGRARP